MITPALLRLFALAAGVAVGNITIAQPLLDELAGAFSISSAGAGVIITVTQVGYGLGLVLLVPLGDTVDRRRLVVTLMQLSAVALAVIATAPSTPVLLAGMAALGFLAVMTQVLVAFAASLADPHDRGRVIGTVTSGVVLGILAARTLAGVTSDVWGWRAAYLAAAVLTSLVGWLLRRALPTVPPTESVVPYRQLVTSMASLVRDEPVLRTRAVLAVVIFATLNVLWSSLALALSSAPRPLSNGAIGLFGVVGLAGAIAARRAGRLADRGLAHVTTGVALAAMTLAWVPIALLTRSLASLVLGLLVLEAAVQAVHVTSQSMIADAVPDARSRAIAAYMVFYAVGSAGGSIASTATYARAGWIGVSVLGAGVSAVGLSVWLATLRRRSGHRDRSGSRRVASELAVHHRDEGVDELAALRTRRAVPGAALGWVADGQRDDVVADEVRRHDPRRHHGHGVARCDRLDQQIGAEGDRRQPRWTRPGRDRQGHGGGPRLVVAVAQHEVDVGEVGGSETGPAGQRMAGVDDSAQLVVEEPLEPNAVDVAGELGDQGDIEAIVEQGGDRVVVGQRLEAHLGARQLLVQRPHDVGHPLEIGRALRRQAERTPMAIGELTKIESGGPQLAERDLGGVEHSPSGGVGDQPAAAPLEQRGRQTLLEAQQALAESRLADVQVTSRRREGGVLAEGVEQLEVTDVNFHKHRLDHSSKFRRGRIDQGSVP